MTTDTTPFDSVPLIAAELNLPDAGVRAVVNMLSEGNTVPFIARYRKEATGGLDDAQIRTIEERNLYLGELEKRREAILASIEEQGKLTDELKAKIVAATTKAVLEDLYLPYKPKRRTRATIAKEKGLGPLADRILEQPSSGDPIEEARAFVSEEKGVADLDEALAGARDIVAETVSENAEIRTLLRESFNTSGTLASEALAGTPDAKTKFDDYFDYKEQIAGIPSHRYLAIRRGEKEGVLKISVIVDEDRLVTQISRKMAVDPSSPFSGEFDKAIDDSYRRLLSPSVENDVRIDLKMDADRQAVDIFASNLKNLLLAAPFGTRSVIGVDPGLRTGCKCAAVDHTGKYLGNMVFNIVRGEGALDQGKTQLISFVKKHDACALAVGNGTGGRETEKFVRDALKEAGLKDVIVVQVSEAGASVYSASDVARDEFPDLDVTVRGAISIARRLQDPLAELVKIEPKSIGVGQYQHDVHQPLLSRKLDEVVEDCVNGVGVELNTASAPLLSQVAGIGPKLSKTLIEHRESNGAFRARKELLKVKGLGPKAFEQAAGFLRIHEGDNPLDASAVHPERYKLVGQIAKDMNIDLSALVGNSEAAGQIDIQRYVGEGVGEPTLRDIIDELKKPGRDPREEFEPPAFRDDVNKPADLKIGMELEGVVTNVTAFGAFVDVGVHRDGLVHISELADRFVKDPNEVVKVGDKLKVRVIEVDMDRERISLSARSPGAERAAPSGRGDRQQQSRGPQGGNRPNKRPGKDQGQPAKKESFSYNPFADLLKNQNR